MTRKGKIARLPRHIRNHLNTRLDNGEQGAHLVEWLNSLPDVTSVLAAYFNARPISEQNLSEWKQGGFLDWQRQQQASDRVRDLVDLSDELDDATGRQSIPNRLAAVLAATLATEVSTLLEATTDPAERWRYLCDSLRPLNQLRQGDHAAFRAEVEMERWDIECQEREEKEHIKELQEMKDRATRPVWDKLKRGALVQTFGGGAPAEAAADYLIEVERLYSEATSLHPELEPSPDSPLYNQTAINPDQARSGQIAPNQTQSPFLDPNPIEHPAPDSPPCDQTAISPDQANSEQIKPNQTRSPFPDSTSPEKAPLTSEPPGAEARETPDNRQVRDGRLSMHIWGQNPEST